MVRFTDDAKNFWLTQSLDKGAMPKRKPASDQLPHVHYSCEWFRDQWCLC